MSQTRGQQRFTISEVADDWHKRTPGLAVQLADCSNQSQSAFTP